MNPKPITEARNPLLALALPALKRARKRAEAVALATNTELIQVVGGKIVRVRPTRARCISLVTARRNLGRIVAEVGRTGTPVSLTRRGKIVARIVPEVHGPLADLTRELHDLREPSSRGLKRRTARRPRAKRRH